MTTTWVPLRENYFATPLLSAKEKSYLVRKSCEAAQEVVERARSTGGPVQWRHVEKFQDVQIYAGSPRNGGALAQPADVVSMCGVTSVAASVKEVAALFDLSTTRAMKEFAVDHRELFFDAVVLYTLSPRTKERPLHQVTAKWVATKSPRGVADRDFCYLECQDKFVDSHGRKGWVLCLHSIKLPGCDDLTREFGFVRGSFYHSGIIVVESDRPGFVDLIHILQINYKQNAHVSPSFVRERVAFVAKVRALVRNKRLNEQRYLSDLELVPKKYRSRCTVCQDSFSLLLLRKMNCRKCGEVVCGACSKEFDVRNAKFMETVKLRICMHCFQLITTAQKSQIPMLEQSRASTNASLLGYYEDDQRASFLTQQTPASAAEMAQAVATPQQQQQRRTKIFLQSMQRQRAAPPPRSGHAQPPPAYYQAAPQSRSSPPLRPSQLGGVYPSRGSVLDHASYSRETISYGGGGARPPQSAASIFDRPTTAVVAAAAAPQSASRAYDYNRQSEYAQDYVVRSRSNTQQSATRGNRASSRQENYSHNSAYRYEQQRSPGSFDYGMPEPLPVSYPSSFRGSESKRRDSESSESSTSSIDIDADEVPQSAAAVKSPDGAGRRLSAAAAIPASPPLYYSESHDGRSDQQRQQQQEQPRGRSPSYPVPFTHSQASGSYDGKSQFNSAVVEPPSPPRSNLSNDIEGDGYSDEESEGSIGSGDEVDFAGLAIKEEVLASKAADGVTSLRNGEKYVDETKAQELADTPVSAPPSPSARLATQEVFARASSVSSSFQQQPGSPTQVTAGMPGQRTSEASEDLSKRSEYAFDIRDSELALNSAKCDTSFLDSDMRRFHDQLWVMKNERRSFEDKDDPLVAHAVGSSTAAQSELQRGRAGSVRSSASRTSSRSAESMPQTTPSDAAFAVSQPLLSVSNHVTSPKNSYEGMPSLYAKPQDPRRSSPRHIERQGTIALNAMDNDPPPSYFSSVARLSSESATEFAKQRRSGSRHSSSSVSSSSSSGKNRKFASVVHKEEDEEESNGPQSFFGAISDDVPPQFQQVRSMAGFSPTATYELPPRSEEETQELMRKLSTPAMVSHDVEDSKSEPEHESRANVKGVRFSDDREEDFGVFDGAIVHDSAALAAPPATVMFEDDEDEEEEVEEEEEEEEDPLLSARSLFKTFGSSKKITSLVGGKDAFQRTFDKIQASFDMLSSDDESEDDDDDDGNVQRAAVAATAKR